MGVDPTRPGIAYRTDKDLRSLFTTFPRADDGSKAEVPNLMADTIQPVVDIGSAGAFAFAALVALRINATGVAPAQNTAFTTVPAGRNWIVWRSIAFHTDVVAHQMWLGVDPGFGTFHAVSSSISATNFTQLVKERPVVIKAGGSIAAFLDGALTAGLLNIDIIYSDFADSDVLPSEVTMGF